MIHETTQLYLPDGAWASGSIGTSEEKSGRDVPQSSRISNRSGSVDMAKPAALPLQASFGSQSAEFLNSNQGKGESHLAGAVSARCRPCDSLTSFFHVQFAMELIGQAMTLPLEDVAIMRNAVSIYASWLLELETRPHYFRQQPPEDKEHDLQWLNQTIFKHLSKLFHPRSVSNGYIITVPNSGTHLPSVTATSASSTTTSIVSSSAILVELAADEGFPLNTRGAQGPANPQMTLAEYHEHCRAYSELCQTVLKVINMAVRSLSASFTEFTWSLLLKVLLGITDSLLRESLVGLQHVLPGVEGVWLAQELSEQLIRLLMETWLRSKSDSVYLWDKLKQLTANWSHRAEVVQQWSYTSLGLTNRIIRLTCGPSQGTELVTISFNGYNVSLHLPDDYVVYAWHQTMNLMGTLENLKPLNFRLAIEGITRMVAAWKSVGFAVDPLDSQECLITKQPFGCNLSANLNTLLHVFGDWLFGAAMVVPPDLLHTASAATLPTEYRKGRAEAFSILCLLFSDFRLIKSTVTSEYWVNFRAAIVFGLEKSQCTDAIYAIITSSADLFIDWAPELRSLAPVYVAAIAKYILPRTDLPNSPASSPGTAFNEVRHAAYRIIACCQRVCVDCTASSSNRETALANYIFSLFRDPERSFCLCILAPSILVESNVFNLRLAIRLLVQRLFADTEQAPHLPEVAVQVLLARSFWPSVTNGHHSPSLIILTALEALEQLVPLSENVSAKTVGDLVRLLCEYMGWLQTIDYACVHLPLHLKLMSCVMHWIRATSSEAPQSAWIFQNRDAGELVTRTLSSYNNYALKVFDSIAHYQTSNTSATSKTTLQQHLSLPYCHVDQIANSINQTVLECAILPTKRGPANSLLSGSGAHSGSAAGSPISTSSSSVRASFSQHGQHQSSLQGSQHNANAAINSPAYTLHSNSLHGSSVGGSVKVQGAQGSGSSTLITDTTTFSVAAIPTYFSSLLGLEQHLQQLVLPDVWYKSPEVSTLTPDTLWVASWRASLLNVSMEVLLGQLVSKLDFVSPRKLPPAELDNKDLNDFDFCFFALDGRTIIGLAELSMISSRPRTRLLFWEYTGLSHWESSIKYYNPNSSALLSEEQQEVHQSLDIANPDFGWKIPQKIMSFEDESNDSMPTLVEEVDAEHDDPKIAGESEMYERVVHCMQQEQQAPAKSFTFPKNLKESCKSERKEHASRQAVLGMLLQDPLDVERLVPLPSVTVGEILAHDDTPTKWQLRVPVFYADEDTKHDPLSLFLPLAAKKDSEFLQFLESMGKLVDAREHRGFNLASSSSLKDGQKFVFPYFTNSAYEVAIVCPLLFPEVTRGAMAASTVCALPLVPPLCYYQNLQSNVLLAFTSSDRYKERSDYLKTVAKSLGGGSEKPTVLSSGANTLAASPGFSSGSSSFSALNTIDMSRNGPSVFVNRTHGNSITGSFGLGLLAYNREQSYSVGKDSMASSPKLSSQITATSNLTTVSSQNSAPSSSHVPSGNQNGSFSNQVNSGTQVSGRTTGVALSSAPPSLVPPVASSAANGPSIASNLWKLPIAVLMQLYHQAAGNESSGMLNSSAASSPLNGVALSSSSTGIVTGSVSSSSALSLALYHHHNHGSLYAESLPLNPVSGIPITNFESLSINEQERLVELYEMCRESSLAVLWLKSGLDTMLAARKLANVFEYLDKVRSSRSKLHALLAISPLEDSNGLYSIRVIRIPHVDTCRTLSGLKSSADMEKLASIFNDDLNFFGPLTDGCILPKSCLGALVRAAVLAERRYDSLESFDTVAPLLPPLSMINYSLGGVTSSNSNSIARSMSNAASASPASLVDEGRVASLLASQQTLAPAEVAHLLSSVSSAALLPLLQRQAALYKFIEGKVASCQVSLAKLYESVLQL